MKTIKFISLAFTAIFLASPLYSQTLRPNQYAVIKTEQIARPATKAKDGTFSGTGLGQAQSLLFTPSNEYLYILNTDKEQEGLFVVYDVAKKTAIKTFKLPPTTTGYNSRFTFNPLNIHQLAVTINRAEIMVLPDWRTEPDNAFDKKKPDGSNRITISGKMDGAKYAFSTDAKSLYFAEYQSDNLKVIDLATGKAEKKSLPKGKQLHTVFAKFGEVDAGTPFIGNDEAVLFYQKDKKKIWITNADVYNIATGQVTRSYELDGSSPINYLNNPHIFMCLGGLNSTIYNLRTGETDNSPKPIVQAVKNESNTMVANLVPSNNNGFVLNYLYYKKENLAGSNLTRTESVYTLFFLNRDGSKAYTSFPVIGNEPPATNLFQLSPNGKYIVFVTTDKCIIATL